MATSRASIARMAAAYTSRLILSNNMEAGRALQAALGIPSDTTRHHLKGLPLDEIKARFLALDTPPPAEPVAPTTMDEHVDIARLKREVAESRRRAEDLALELGAARDFRANVLGLVSAPLAPRPIKYRKTKDGALTWCIPLSDNHLGKRIALDEVSGLQMYNVEIARNRVRRTFERAVDLIHRNGNPVDRLLVVLMGDNVNGALRHDDDRSNEIPPIEQARVFAECARDGIEFLKDQFGCDVEVVVLPGNHGRTTANPPSVEIGENYDCIAGMLLEWHYQKDDRVRVSNTGQADAMLEIYGRGYLFTHGDRIGARGGDGQIGALGPTKRGSLRIGTQELELSQYISERPRLAAVIMGHFHYHWTDYDVYVSGAGCGPDPWAMLALRAKPKPPYQWLLGFHPEKGIIEEKRLFIGHPDEGPICSFRSVA